MKYGTNRIVVDLGQDFIDTFDEWKKQINLNKIDSITSRLRTIIKDDCEMLKNGNITNKRNS